MQKTLSRSTYVYLNLEGLENFEMVEHQFQNWGVKFNNVMALEPSNNAYPPRSGKMVLMGAPRDGWIEAKFKRPIDLFQCYVTSSKRTVLSAYDSNEDLVARSETPGPNLQSSDTGWLPNMPLIVSGKRANIHRITLYTFDGQLTIDDLSIAF